ncbi:hypothetical protein ACFW9D_16060 [Streptomyces sp. NPDC059524]|uniref:hypothetical protein n=1 Tax=Streptomyces sp. NPDC059524 TaxID=3346856 RepID=UPI0036A3851D
MESPHLAALLRDITSARPEERALSADRVTDRISACTPEEAATLATALAACAAEEEDLTALESQLHAILELTSTGYVRQRHLARLGGLRSRELPEELLGYLHDLLEDDGVETPRLQLVSVEAEAESESEAEGDEDEVVCVVWCVGGVVRVGDVFAVDGVVGEARWAVSRIDRYGRPVEMFDPPHGARVILVGGPRRGLGRGVVLVALGGDGRVPG